MLRSLSLGCVVTLALVPCAADAAMMAFDSQADPVYASWDPGDNGGTGWGGGWTFRNQGNVVLNTTNGNRGWFVANSTLNNSGPDSNGDGDINSPSTQKAWGLYSNAVDQVYAIRPFSSALLVGQTVSWDMDNGNITSGQVIGLRFLSNTSDVNSRQFEARFVGGDANYSIIGNPNMNSTIPFSREGLHFEYTLTGATSFTLEITRLVNGATQTINGNNVSGAAIMGLAFKNQFAGSGDVSNGYLNNIRVIPEPGTIMLLGFGAALVLRRRT